MLDPQTCRRAILAVETLGAAPPILAKVKKLIKDPNVDFAQVCELIRHDPALTADIIRLSNSVFYAPVQPHTNLLSAVSAIGFRELGRVINLSISRQFLARDLASYGISAVEYWGASVTVALLMSKLAQSIQIDYDDAHTVGMLHAIGRVLINRVIEDFRYTVFWDGKHSLEEWEREAVGFDYAEAGALLLRHWNFPEEICNVIQWQIYPEKLSAQRSLLGILQFALRILPRIGVGFSNNVDVSQLDAPFLCATNLVHAQLIPVLETSKNEFNMLLDTLDLVWVARERADMARNKVVT